MSRGPSSFRVSEPQAQPGSASESNRDMRSLRPGLARETDLKARAGPARTHSPSLSAAAGRARASLGDRGRPNCQAGAAGRCGAAATEYGGVLRRFRGGRSAFPNIRHYDSES